MIFLEQVNGSITRVSTKKLDDKMIGFEDYPEDILVFGCAGKYRIEEGQIIPVEGWEPEIVNDFENGEV